MTACDIHLNYDEVLAKVSNPLARKIAHSVELLQKSEKLALRLDPQNGFYLAFSGGKDSQCLYHVAKLAGVRFAAHMNLTSVDPPNVIRFVKTQYPDVELIKPRISIYEMAKKKNLPTRTLRWCCAEYKEKGGIGTATLVGIRKKESTRRSKREEISYTTKKDGKINETFDQWSEHEETMVACIKGKDKFLISPIIYWTERDVWEFLNVNGIPHCNLYDQGYHRIGCICCPMSNLKQKIKDIQRYPHVKRNWLKTIKWLIDNGYAFHNLDDEDICFRWWISGKNFKSFYSEEFIQQKLNFDNEKTN